MGMYFARLEANPGMAWINGVSNLFMSDQASETYTFLGQSPAMREWIGGRQPKGFSQNSVTIANRHYEATIEIAKRCNLTLQLGKPKLPDFPTPDGMTIDEFLVQQSQRNKTSRGNPAFLIQT